MKKFIRGEYNKQSDSHRRSLFWYLLIILFLAIAAFGGYLIYQKYEAMKHEQDVEEGGEARKDQVSYNGETYRYNYNMKNILIMGIDQNEESMQVEGAMGGQSDLMLLIALDRETQEVTLISIPRDTMAQVKLYDMFGAYSGIEKQQITLAYAYGDGGVMSANLAVDATSKLFYGIQIDRYYALRMDATPIIHQICGDVIVTLNEKMPNLFPDAEIGDIVVIGEEEADRYLRYRDTSVSGSSLLRVQRQNEYLASLGAMLSDTLVDSNKWLELYNALSSYMVTNLSVSEAEELSDVLSERGLNSSDIITLEGEMKATDLYDEYHVDEDKLYELILDIFYEKVEQ